ncbi:HutD family protein [Roseomonas gilardii]|uniref:HutD/Ves family protein n=1 Tax=Roseomonas gilardii TaxID=257708 RepID=UPI0016439262|nr:HutD family protein [Roseomonas gilardii]
MSILLRDQIIRAAELQARPWPNGLGISRNIVVHEDCNGHLAWMISIADLTSDAAFSHFPGGDRIFTLIDGPGCTLSLDGRDALACRPLVPSCFPGDVPTYCTMRGSTGRAFNLVFDRDGFNGQVVVQAVAAGHRLWIPASTTAIHCLDGAAEFDGASLLPGDTALPQGGHWVEAGGSGTTVIAVTVWPRAGA